MASYSHARAVSPTLTGTTADAVTITGSDKVHVINRDPSEWLWVDDVNVAVAEADGAIPIPPLGFAEIDPKDSLSVVGDGNPYSVVGIRK